MNSPTWLGDAEKPSTEKRSLATQEKKRHDWLALKQINLTIRQNLQIVCPNALSKSFVHRAP